MAATLNGWQHDSWLNMATKGPLHPNWNFEFSDVWFNLTSCGLKLLLCKITLYGSHFMYHVEASHQSETRHSLIFLAAKQEKFSLLNKKAFQYDEYYPLANRICFGGGDGGVGIPTAWDTSYTYPLHTYPRIPSSLHGVFPLPDSDSYSDYCSDSDSMQKCSTGTDSDAKVAMKTS